MLKIGFLILRDTMLKTLGSLIEASLDHGHIVTLLYDERSVSGTKAYQRITRDKLVFFEELGATLCSVDSNDLDKAGGKLDLEVLVMVEGFHFFYEHEAKLKVLRENGMKIVSLSNFFENLRYPLDSLDSFDKVFYLSSFAVDTHFALYGKPADKRVRKKYASKIKVSGSPMFDQMVDLKSKNFRSELGVPNGKKVVVLFSPVINPTTDWRFYLWRGRSKIGRLLRILSNGKFQYVLDAFQTPTFEEIASSIRDFCNRNDAFLIIKSRAKQQDPPEFQEIADLYMSGENEVYFPEFTGYKLLATADLCITSMSMAVLEAIAANVPVVNIYVPPTEQKPVSTAKNDTDYLDKIMNARQENPFKYTGCITSVDRQNAAAWFKDKKLENQNIDQKARSHYLERFLGFSSKTSSERILTSIKSLVTQ